jgi:hypothetical protein
MRAQLWRGSVFFLLMLTASLASFAQVDTAGLQGTVTDPQGAAAVGATVLITSVETGRANSTTTSDLGFYSASALPPGRYRIEVTQQGCLLASGTSLFAQGGRMVHLGDAHETERSTMTP